MHDRLDVVAVLAAEGWMRLQRRRDALSYAIGGGVSAALAVLLIVPRAQTEPFAVALVLAVAAVTWLVANLRWRFGEITYACSAALAAAFFFAFRHFDGEAPFAAQLLWSLMTHASVCLLAATVMRFGKVEWLRDVYRIPLQFTCLAGTACIVGLSLSNKCTDAVLVDFVRRLRLARGNLADARGARRLGDAIRRVSRRSASRGSSASRSPSRSRLARQEPYALHIYGVRLRRFAWRLKSSDRFACSQPAIAL